MASFPETKPKVSRFRLYSESDLRWIVDRTQRAISGWASQWLPSASCEVKIADCISDGTADAPNRWLVAARGDASLLGIESPVGWEQHLKPALAGLPSDGNAETSPVTLKMAQVFLHSLAECVLRESGLVSSAKDCSWSEQPPVLHDAQRSGGGFLGMICRVGDFFTLHLVFWPDLIVVYTDGDARRPVAGSDNVVPRTRAIETQTVVLEAVAGEAELSLSELQTLAVGDVIRLDGRIERPIVVRLADTGPVCRGHLGRAKGRKAVQLAFSKQ